MVFLQSNRTVHTDLLFTCILFVLIFMFPKTAFAVVYITFVNTFKLCLCGSANLPGFPAVPIQRRWARWDSSPPVLPLTVVLDSSIKVEMKQPWDTWCHSLPMKGKCSFWVFPWDLVPMCSQWARAISETLSWTGSSKWWRPPQDMLWSNELSLFFPYLPPVCPPTQS